MSNEAAQAQNRQAGNSWFGVLMEIYRVNEQYIQEVVDASRKILQIVLDGLVPGDHLKHTPVRSCFRILSGMIFILKVRFTSFISVKPAADDHARRSHWVPKKTTCVCLWTSRIESWKPCEPTSSMMCT